MPTDRTMQFVIKVSKFCNLRCQYCYELPELGNRERMSTRQLATMYEHIRDFVVERDRADGVRSGVSLIWHGGEPLLLEPEFYWTTFADQRRVFGDAVEVRNAVQTNLTRLDESRVELLRDGFDQVGVSLDLYGQLRINLAGHDSQDRVLDHLETLRTAGVAFGCITVLTRRNLHRLDSVFRFYDRSGIGFRVLPLFDAASDEQTEQFALTLDEELSALCRTADLWLESDRMKHPPAPLGTYVDAAARVVADTGERRYYNRRNWPWVVLVNTSGDCYTQGEPYGDPSWSIGNVFTTPLTEILAGGAFDRSAREAERRQAANCLSCPFYGYCDGLPVAEAERRGRDADDEGVQACTARPVIGHIASRMRAGARAAAVEADAPAAAVGADV
ncbi:radical SAM protein [Streptomyces sp. NPDC050504]|uniref:radical SAM protein n=1 Tax=Streptomyces sp. NPDC050504 TaxID=3365618 RepID=UPI0037908B35